MKISLIIVQFLYVCLSFFGFVKFYVWQQILEIAYGSGIFKQSFFTHDEILNQVPHPNLHIFDLILSGHIHALRYSIMLPIILISNLFNIQLNKIFSIFICFLIVYLSKILTTLFVKIFWHSDQKKINYIYNLFFFLFFLLLSFFMNGRMVIGLFGMTLLLNNIIVWNLYGRSLRKFLLMSLISLYFTCISTGCFITTTITLFVNMYFVFYEKKTFMFSNKNKNDFIFIFISATIVIYLFIIFAKKNVSFFGGEYNSLILMLAHGYGSVFITGSHLTQMIAFLSAIVFLLVSSFIFSNFKKLNVPLVSVVISCICGAFGYSTLTMAIPGLAVILLWSICTLGVNQQGS